MIFYIGRRYMHRNEKVSLTLFVLLILALILAIYITILYKHRASAAALISARANTFEYSVYEQLHPELHIGNLLSIVAFPQGRQYLIRYIVKQDGKESDWRDAYEDIQGQHSKQIAAPDLTTIRSALANLPGDAVPPSLDRTVKISFYEKDKLVTRTYDTMRLPQAMRQIYDIIGERFESKRNEAKQQWPGAIPQ